MIRKIKGRTFASTFVKVHGSNTLTAEARESRKNTLMQHPGIIGKDLDLPLTMSELKRAIANARETSPGNDGICYKMLANMKDS